MKITVVGAGYVGLSLATLLSQKNKVTIYEIIKDKVDLINKRVSPIKDKYIEDFFENKKLDLIATNKVEDALCSSDFVIVATPTNYNSEIDMFDTSSVEKTIELVSVFNKNACVIVKSTVNIGFTKKISEKYPDLNILFSPEFLREGNALYDNLYPSRIVVGVYQKNELSTKLSHQFICLLKECAFKENIESNIVGCTEAESIKLFANTYLALRVSYFNELDTFALENNLNAKEIIDGVCGDPRIGNFYNNPSFGYGGYCLPKDTKQLKSNFVGIKQNLISAVVESNETRKNVIVESIDKFYRTSNKQSRKIGVYRLIMKSGSDNFREAAIFDVIKGLTNKGHEIIVYEPSLNENPFSNHGISLENNLETFKKQSKIIIANRLDDNFDELNDFVFSRDIYSRD